MIEFNRNTNFRIDELELLLEKKEVDISSYKEKIAELEEKITKFQTDSPNFKPSKKDKENFNRCIEEKEAEIRDLKDKMSYLRKENIDLKKKIESDQKQNNTFGSVIHIEREKPPLQVLVDDLQSKLISQKFLIANLKNELEQVKQYQHDKSLKLQEAKVENAGFKQKMYNYETELESLKHSLANLEILYLEGQKSTEKDKLM